MSITVLTTAILQVAQPASETGRISESLMKWMFTTGVVSIAITWTIVPIVFAYKNKLDEMLDLLRRGAVIRFVTITYIVLVIVVLGLINVLDGEKISTLLGSIAGYVLGLSK